MKTRTVETKCSRPRFKETTAFLIVVALCTIALLTQGRHNTTSTTKPTPAALPTKDSTVDHVTRYNFMSSSIPWNMKDQHPGFPAADILKLVVPTFMKDYKNPCWVDYNRVQCLPYFFIAGMPKCGSTDLWFSLKKHPQTRLLQAKEPHWWTRKQYFAGGSLARYVNYFGKSAAAISHYVERLDGRLYHPLVTGDGSASTLWDNFHWREIPENGNGTTEPVVLHIHLIRYMLPNSKIIIILRNPIDRAYSGYLYFTKPAIKSKERFHTLCTRAVTAFNNCTSTHTTRYCVYNRLPYISSQTTVRLFVGLYYIFITDWLKVFPREQLHFIRMEKYSRDRAKVLNSAFRFLELDPYINATEVNAMPVKNQRNQTLRQKMGKMFNKTRTLLTNFYKPYNDKLRLLLEGTDFDFSNFDE